MSAEIRASNPVEREGEKILVTTAKGGPEGSTIRRTIRGEISDLQIKWDDSGEIGHLHCVRHGQSSEYNRAGSMKLEDLYDVVKVLPSPVLRIKCLTCGKEWFSDGFIEEMRDPNAPKEWYSH